MRVPSGTAALQARSGFDIPFIERFVKFLSFVVMNPVPALFGSTYYDHKSISAGPDQFDDKDVQEIMKRFGQILIMTALLGMGNAMAENKTLDWDTAVFSTAVFGGGAFSNIDFGMGTANLRYTTTAGQPGGRPLEADTYDGSGGFGNGDSIIHGLATGGTTTTLTMSQAVTNFRVTIYDIDNSDVITITAANGGTNITNTITYGTIGGTQTYTRSGNVVSGNGNNSGGGSDNGSLNLTIAGPMTSLTVSGTGTANDQFLFALSDILLVAPDPPAPPGGCPLNSLNWNNQTYVPGVLPQTFVVTDPSPGFPAVTFGFSYTGNTADFAGGTPNESSAFAGAGGLAAGSNKIAFLHDPSPNTDPSLITLAINMNTTLPGLRFSLYDLDSFPFADGGTPDFTDQVIIRGFRDNVQVNPIFQTLSNGSTIGYQGNQMNGHRYDDDSDNSNRSTVNIYFPSAINRIEIAYSDSSGAGGDRQILLSNVQFCRLSSLPVTLTSLTSTRTGNQVSVDWQTASETEHAGYEIELFSSTDPTAEVLARQFVASEGSFSARPRDYRMTFDLAGESAGADQVLLNSIDISGKEQSFGPYPIGESHGQKTRAQDINWAHNADNTRQPMADRGWSPDGLRLIDSEERPRGELKQVKRSDVEQALIQVSEDGMVRVTHQQLIERGVDFTGLAGDQLAVTVDGVAVARHVVMAAPEQGFRHGDWIDFHGRGLADEDALYAPFNHYLISADASRARPARIQQGPFLGEPEPWYLERIEQNNNRLYSFAVPGADPWYDRELLAFRGPASTGISFQTSEPVRDAPTTVRLNLVGVTSFESDRDHHITATLNQRVPIINAFSDGLTLWQPTAEVEGRHLFEGLNTITLTAPGDTGNLFDLIYLDGFTVEYPRRFVAMSDRLSFRSSGSQFVIGGFRSSEISAYGVVEDELVVLPVDLSGPATARSAQLAAVTADTLDPTASPVALADVQYHLFSQSRAPQARVSLHRSTVAPTIDADTDMLIIAHPAFIGDPLTDYALMRTDQGIQTAVVDLFEIYAAHTDGMPLPRAMVEYLRDITTQSAVSHVLLVGGDSFDYRNYTGSDSISFVPTLYTRTNDLIHFTPSDGLLADLDGDRVQDLAIGRWPVRNLDELSSMIGKTVAFEESGLSARQSALLVAGRSDEAQPSFAEQSERLAEQLQLNHPDGWTQQTRVYVDDLDPNLSAAEARELAQQQLISAIDDGASLTVFSGHGSPSQWTFDGLLTSETVSRLGNSGKPTLIMPLTCYTTYFVDPAVNSLSHQLLNTLDRGAVAVHGAATLSHYSDNEVLSTRILRRMLDDGETLGEAILRAKQQLREQSGDRYETVLINWALLGDPSLRIE